MPDGSGAAVADQARLTVVIATYRREGVLIESLRHLMALQPSPDEIVVVDQTEKHEPATERQLAEWHEKELISWVRRSHPSIPAAMNAGLVAARHGVVLFVDDDVLPNGALVATHLQAQAEHPGLVAGQVMQPGESPTPLGPHEAFRFNSTTPAWVDEFIGCNFSVRRDLALALGGFDENFIGAAYRYEAEFAHRFARRHGPVRFEPRASLRHLQAPAGGTRAHGHHLRTVKPGHSVGAYYFWLRTRVPGWWWSMLLRPLRSIRTRHHLRRPWWIPLTLVAELRGLSKAASLASRAPRLLQVGTMQINGQAAIVSDVQRVGEQG
jgi:GT2 family glycosyltransferase